MFWHDSEIKVLVSFVSSFSLQNELLKHFKLTKLILFLLLIFLASITVSKVCVSG